MSHALLLLCVPTVSIEVPLPPLSTPVYGELLQMNSVLNYIFPHPSISQTLSSYFLSVSITKIYNYLHIFFFFRNTVSLYMEIRSYSLAKTGFERQTIVGSQPCKGVSIGFSLCTLFGVTFLMVAAILRGSCSFHLQGRMLVWVFSLNRTCS